VPPNRSNGGSREHDVANQAQAKEKNIQFPIFR
jgi:hypothetical protein